MKHNKNLSENAGRKYPPLVKPLKISELRKYANLKIFKNFF